MFEKDNKHKTFHFPEKIIISSTEGGKRGGKSFKTQAQARMNRPGDHIHFIVQSLDSGSLFQ